MTTFEDNQAHEETSPRLTHLLAEREHHIRRLRQVHREFGGWSIGVGKLRIQAVVDTNVIAIVFVLWHLLLGAAGVAAILSWEGGRELGVALLVSALFSFGSFLAQFWSQAMDRQREFVEKVWHEDDVQLLRETLATLATLDNQINRRLRESREAATA